MELLSLFHFSNSFIQYFHFYSSSFANMDVSTDDITEVKGVENKWFDALMTEAAEFPPAPVPLIQIKVIPMENSRRYNEINMKLTYGNVLNLCSIVDGMTFEQLKKYVANVFGLNPEHVLFALNEQENLPETRIKAGDVLAWFCQI